MLISPVQGGTGVDESIQRLVALTVVLGLSEADRPALLDPGDNLLGGQLPKIFLHRACAGSEPRLAPARRVFAR